MGNNKRKCTECGELFQNLGQHWRFKKSHKPEFSDYQMEILKGILMGDGSMERKGGNHNPKFICSMSSKEYLKYVDDELGILSLGVTEGKTPEESAKSALKGGFSDNPDAKDYKQMYWLKTTAHKQLTQLADWYKTGDKVWPSDIYLSPVVLKHFYCCDGNYHNTEKADNIRFALSNEVDNKEKVESLFENIGFEISNWYIRERESGGYYASISFTKEESYAMFDYMGEPIDDFEYKWPEEFK